MCSKLCLWMARPADRLLKTHRRGFISSAPIKVGPRGRPRPREPHDPRAPAGGAGALGVGCTVGAPVKERPPVSRSDAKSTSTQNGPVAHGSWQTCACSRERRRQRRASFLLLCCRQPDDSDCRRVRHHSSAECFCLRLTAQQSSSPAEAQTLKRCMPRRWTVVSGDAWRWW